MKTGTKPLYNVVITVTGITQHSDTALHICEGETIYLQAVDEMPVQLKALHGFIAEFGNKQNSASNEKSFVAETSNESRDLTRLQDSQDMLLIAMRHQPEIRATLLTRLDGSGAWFSVKAALKLRYEPSEAEISTTVPSAVDDLLSRARRVLNVEGTNWKP
ncbi:hypothetical protein CTT31_02205 [Pseudoalteromonas maricaloris]|uniref:hypothetical protein n=1 Tax=Pseudoalteromonas maricaloris TaxID=184924 RepID=UPI0021ADEB71|nr:hypothetical protein [Pseudoalteromonas flavipulchra]USE67995.1 hypothetical protein CTT31_02205 [Pseudoalteromonas flavipulchra]